MDIAQFRLNFPEFTDVVRFPDSVISYHAGVAECLHSSEAFRCAYTPIINLYVAHYITMAARASTATASGGTSTAGSGAISQKSIGSRSISYDTGQTTIIYGAGHWNSTPYGLQYIDLRKNFGKRMLHVI